MLNIANDINWLRQLSGAMVLEYISGAGGHMTEHPG